MGKGKTLSIKDSKSKALNVSENEDLMLYLKSIEKYEKLTAEEERALFEKLETATGKEKLKIRDEIINRNQKLVYTIALKYCTNDNIMDLISEGNLGLIDSMKDANDGGYDYKSGYRFSTFSTFFIKKNMLQYIINECTQIKKPNNNRTFFLLEKICEKFYEEYGVEPTSNDIVQIFEDEYGIKLKNNSDVFKLYVNSLESYRISNNDDNDGNLEYSSALNKWGYSRNDYIVDINNEYTNEKINFLSKTLNENEMKIINLAYGLNDGEAHTNKEIASMLDMTPEGVRLVKNKAIAKMKACSAKMDINI